MDEKDATECVRMCGSQSRRVFECVSMCGSQSRIVFDCFYRQTNVER